MQWFRRVFPSLRLPIIVVAIAISSSGCCVTLVNLLNLGPPDTAPPLGPMVIVTTTTTPLPTTLPPPPTVPSSTRPTPTTPSTEAPPQIDSFVADPSSGPCVRFASTTLTWTTTGAASVALDGQAVAPSGSTPRSVQCNTSRSFTLVASNAEGALTQRTVTVDFSG